MVRELEQKGIPTAHMVNMVPVAQSIGSTRIVKTTAIPYPLGNPLLSDEEQHNLRYRLVKKAVDALGEDIGEQTLYE